MTVPMGRTVLVADSDRAYRSALERLYARLGYSVLSTPSGLESLEAFRGGSVDLAVLDYHLEGMTAVDVISIARDEGIATLVIVTIGENPSRVEREVRSVGVDFFLQKPYPLYDIELVTTKLFQTRNCPSSHSQFEEQTTKRRHRNPRSSTSG